MQKKIRVYAAAVIASIFFGLTFLGAKIALTQLDAVQVLACRWTLSFVLFAILVALRVIKVDYRKKPIKWLAVLAFIQPCINTICETVGVDLTTASESAIIYAMIPIAVVVISGLFLKEKITPMVGGGVVLAFVGVIISIAFADNFSLGGKLSGYLCLAAMVVTGALFTILSARLSTQFTSMERTFAMAAIATIWFNGLNVVRGKGFSGFAVCFQDASVGLAILFLGAIGSFFCYIVINYVVTHLPASQASSIQVNVTSLSGVISGIIVQGDPFGWYTVVGMILVVIGVVAANMQTPDDGSDEDAGGSAGQEAK